MSTGGGERSPSVGRGEGQVGRGMVFMEKEAEWLSG